VDKSVVNLQYFSK